MDSWTYGQFEDDTANPRSFSKVGTRNAMVISMVGVCLILDEERRNVRLALGSVAPTIVRANQAEAFAAQIVPWDDPDRDVSQADLEGFGELVAARPSPITDVRGTAEYRTHACRVLAKRALSWALADRRASRSG